MRRHNILRDNTADFMKYGLMGPLIEPPGLTKGKERPADILVPEGLLGKPLVIDVAVTDPFQPKYLNKILAGGEAAEIYAEEVKVDKHADTVNKQGYDYAPFVMETTGGLNAKAIQIVAVTASKIAQRFGSDPVREGQKIFCQLAVVLQRANAAMVSTRTTRDTEGWWRED